MQSALQTIAGSVANPNVPRNLIEGGDFTTNPWIRGTSFTAIANTNTYTADRWSAVGGASSSISVSQQAIASGYGLSFGQALQFGRANANADTTAIKLLHVVETNDSIRAAGTNLCLSFYAKAGANFSAANGQLTATVYGGTGSNQSAANMLAGTWTGQTTLYSGPVYISNTAWGPRFVINNNGAGIAVPANVTQLGVVLSYVPVGTAGANDWVQFAGLQLETGLFASPFECLDQAMVTEVSQRFAVQINEPAAGVVVGAGMNTGANAQLIFIPLPTPMLKAPTVTVGTTGPAWKANLAGVATAATLSAGTTHTAYAISLTGNAACTQGQACMLQGGGGTGTILVSCDF